MKIKAIVSLLSSGSLLAASLLISSCGTPNPTLQKEMDQDILTAAENRKAGNTTGPQQGQGSKNYGHGGY